MAKYSTQDYQPKAVVTVEKLPARNAIGSISMMPEGSPWCDGRPTYWLVGHHVDNKPWCLVLANNNSSDSSTADFTDFTSTTPTRSGS